MRTPKHPIQPVVVDAAGAYRFKKNAIVCFLLEHGGFDMNKLATMDFSDEDREQFAQLIGYSVGGACELSYVSDLVASAGLRAAKQLATPMVVRTFHVDEKGTIHDGFAQKQGDE